MDLAQLKYATLGLLLAASPLGCVSPEVIVDIDAIIDYFPPDQVKSVAVMMTYDSCGGPNGDCTLIYLLDREISTDPSSKVVVNETLFANDSFDEVEEITSEVRIDMTDDFCVLDPRQDALEVIIDEDNHSIHYTLHGSYVPRSYCD